jgi:2-C-methyl-D-erythritol 4-phosphate cytidylyltransferase/2-C-methyl-D-erythritol 2,4-cyclodiphosphate synthase
LKIRLKLSEITLVLLSAGSSTRFGASSKKQWLRVGAKPLWLFVTEQFLDRFEFAKVIIVGANDELGYMRQFGDFEFIAGGKERQDSLKNALDLVETEYVMTSDVARCCIDEDTIYRIIDAKNEFDCVAPFIKAPDTIVHDGTTIDRNSVMLIQTPQLSRTHVLKRSLQNQTLFTDDSSAIKASGGNIGYVEGSNRLKKLTSFEDTVYLDCLKAPSAEQFVGFGIDIHGFEDGKRMVLGGVEIVCDYGFKAHSDGDVLIHSIIDALLGAAGLGDIGEHFPDSDGRYKNADSTELLHLVLKKIWGYGYEIVNVDCTIIAQKPRLENYKQLIRQKMSKMLGLCQSRVNIKATTAEKMGFIGRGEGVCVQSVATLKFFDWTKQ